MPKLLVTTNSDTPMVSISIQSSQSATDTQEVKDVEQQAYRRGKARSGTWRLKVDSKFVYDAILGLSDGLTVPFALTAGLASVGSTRIVILGGLAELVAGAISMGLGGFIGSKSEFEAYQTQERKCHNLLALQPQHVHTILDAHFAGYHLAEAEREQIVTTLMSSHDLAKSFLLRHHFGAEKPDSIRPYSSALTLGLSYFLGGFLALIPYFCVRRDHVSTGLWWSVGIMGVVMLIFGYVKTCVVRGWSDRDNVIAGIKGALQMLVIGALAVGAAVGLVKAIQHGSSYS